MPIYKFRCVNCDYTEEKLQKLNDPHPRCPCGFIMVKALTTPGSFNLKGKGFYKNDYKGK